MRKTSSARKASPAFLQRVGNNIKRLREARGYSQQELADRIGRNKSLIGKLEGATLNVTIDTLDTVAQGLGCDVGDLLRRRANG